MPPADRPVRRSTLGRIRPLDAVIVASVAALFLGLAMPWLGARWPGATGGLLGRLGEPTGEEAVLEALIEVANEKALEHVVLQLVVGPTPFERYWPDQSVPWGHVPELTLFDDGTVVYLDGAHSFPPIPVEAHLDMTASQALVDAVVALGFDHLAERPERPSYIDSSYPIEELQTSTIRLRHAGAAVEHRFVHEPVMYDEPPLDEPLLDFLLRWTAAETSPQLDDGAVLYRGDDIVVDDETWIESTPLEDAGSTASALEPMIESIGITDAVITPPEWSPWPDTVRFPERLPHFVNASTAAVLRRSVPLTDAIDVDDPGLQSTHWAWPFIVPVDGDDNYQRIMAVPWIYGDRYPDVERDVEAYARALEAARAARRDAEIAAMTEVAANPPTPGPFASEMVEPLDPTSEPEPVWHPFPPVLRPAPLEASLGIQTWRHWLAAPEDLAPLTDSFAPRFGWLKQRFAWADLEPFGPTDFDANELMMHPDAWLAATRAGTRTVPPRVLIQLDVPPEWARVTPGAPGIPPFDLNPWIRFVRAFAHRYAGQVDAYEILNEPNLAREWGAQPDPEAYAKVLAAAYRAIKLADPHATVISAGLAPTGTDLPKAMDDVAFLERLYTAMEAEGGSDLHLDALGAHAPGFAAAPEVSPDEAAADPALGGARHFAFRRVEDLRAVMEAHGDAGKQIVVTEFGWTTDQRPESPYAWHAVTEAERAARIRDAFDYARENWSPWIGPLIAFSAADPDWTPDDEAWWWSLTTPEGVIRPEIEAAFDMN